MDCHDKLDFPAGCITQNAICKLLPVCDRHVSKWPLTAKMAFGQPKVPCSVGKICQRRQKPHRNTTSGLVSAIVKNGRHWSLESPQEARPIHPQLKAAVKSNILPHVKHSIYSTYKTMNSPIALQQL
jgi:hypothetical protein